MFFRVTPTSVTNSVGPLRFDRHFELQLVTEPHLVWLPVFQISNSIVANGRIYRLREPVNINVSHEHGMWVYEAPTLSILAYGESKASAERSFNEDFCALYHHIAEEQDDRLSPQAIITKREFLRVVEDVRQVGR